MFALETAQGLEDNPIYLKRKGNLEEALHIYADLFAEAVQNENSFLAEKCFEQIFDIYLLKYLRDGVRFASVGDERRRLDADIVGLLQQRQPYEAKSFRNYFDSCWRRFVPRGRGQNVFSVDRRLLLER